MALLIVTYFVIGDIINKTVIIECYVLKGKTSLMGIVHG